MISKITKPAKNFLFCSLFFFIFTAGVFAQYTPNTLTYQAVARDSQGKELAKTALVVKISILANEENGQLEWNEEHEITTNDFGLFTLNIGAGERLKGSSPQFKDVNWSSGAHYLKVEINFGNGFINMGTTQMLAVPYALYAAKSGNSSIDFTGFKFDPLSNTLKSNDTPVADLSPLKQTLEFDQANYHLSISGVPGVVDLRQFIHAPQDLRIANNKIWLTGTADSTIVDLLPYKQSLSVNASSKLEISNGSSSVTVDTSNINEIQGLNLNGNTLKISTEKPIINSVELGKYLDNTDNQTLSIESNNKLKILNGNTVSIDTSVFNEIQGLNLIDDSLKITNNPIIKSISLKKYLDNTDNQSLKITPDNKLHILNSNSVPIDSSVVNELQDLSRLGDSIQITKGKSVNVKDMINVPWVGFSVKMKELLLLPAFSSEIKIIWELEEINKSSVFSNNSFVAAARGIYYFNLFVNVSSLITITIYKNDNLLRTFDCSTSQFFNHSFLLELLPLDNITIKVKLMISGTKAEVLSGYFSGYRVN